MPLAIIAGVATVASSAISASASNKASKAATDAAAANNALQEKIYNNNVGLAQPSITSGNQASGLINNFLGLSGDPAKAKEALNTYLNSTGYNFQFDQGVKAIDSSHAASRTLQSGAALKDLTTFGQNTAQTGANNWLAQLTNIANRGVSSANAVMGVGTSYADAVSANNNSAATNVGNAALINASNINGTLNGVVGALATAKGQSSFGNAVTKQPASGQGGTPWYDSNGQLWTGG